LRSFESSVCDYEKGCWVILEKIVPKEEEAIAGSAKKPAAPAKGKGPATTEELKPVYAKAWLDLRPLLHPGVKSFHQNIFLQPQNLIQNSIGRATPMSEDHELKP
jgi:hypothetical protein